MADCFDLRDVLKLRCGFCNPPKDKYFVVVSIEPEPVLLFINSSLNAFVTNNPKLTPCNVTIDGESHDFLSYDSWIDCCEPCHEFTVEDIQRDFEYGGSNCGKVTIDTLSNIITGITNSKTIKRKTKTLILSSLTPLL